MNNLQIIVTGPFKEKAMLTSIIADKLKEIDIDFIMNDPATDKLVRSNCGDDCLSEFKELETTLVVMTENLQNTNAVEDLVLFQNKLNQPDWKSDKEGWNLAIEKVQKEIRQILLQ